MLRPGAVVAHVHTTAASRTLRPYGRCSTQFRRTRRSPVWSAATPLRSAGRVLHDGTQGEAEVYRAHRAQGHNGSRALAGTWSAAPTRSWPGLLVSSATLHLFGTQQPAFEAELRALLATASPAGQFSERVHPTAVDLWASAR